MGSTATALLALVLLAGGVEAQRGGKKKDAWRQDPYTKNDPAAMAKAGYVSFGPFTWGDDHDTLQIEHILGDEVKLRWIETAHFKIGSSLPEYSVPRDEKEERKRQRKEDKERRKAGIEPESDEERERREPEARDDEPYQPPPL